jgi:mannose-6-phosphate isomerase-like protein (cupin superfamily)
LPTKVERVLVEQHERATKILAGHIDALEAVAAAPVEHETLTGEVTPGGEGPRSLVSGVASLQRVSMDASTTAQPFVLTADAVNALPIERLGSIAGVSHRVVWRNENSMAGVMTIEAGHRLGTHRHRANHHHMWIVSGRARILNVDVAPGSYVHVPSGVDHDIDATETQGCTLFYLYLSPGS